jgi:hypothetical protein
LLAGIFYWPDTHNKKGAIWIWTHANLTLPNLTQPNLT